MALIDTIGPVLGATYWIFIILFVLGIIIFCGWYVWYRRQYRYSVKLRILENERFVYWEDTARKIVESGGIDFWYIKGLKIKVGVPPGEATILSPGGRWVAEGFFDRNNGITWSKDTMSVQQYKDFLTKKSSSSDGSITRTFQPFTSTQRSLVAHQIEKAVTRKGQGLWQILWQLTPMLFMLIVFVLILIFWKDIADPILKVQGSNAEISKTNAQIQQQNLRMYQMLTGGKGNGTYIVQVLPTDEQTFGLQQGEPGG